MNKKWELCNTNAEKIDNICNKFKINKLIKKKRLETIE